MRFRGVEIVCPACRGELRWAPPGQDTLACEACDRHYPVIVGIPDLRLTPDPYIGLVEDRAKGERLAEMADRFDFAGFVAHYYERTPVVPPRHARRYTEGLLAAAGRAERQLGQWHRLAPAPGDAADRRLLDLGCGTAPLLVAAREMFVEAVGVDIAFRWLVVAQKRLSEAGLDFPLLCASADALPFPASAFDVVAAESVIEHLTVPGALLEEARRVLAPEGAVWLTTPNRWSLGPDPHTGLPAGGLLPRGLVARYVRRLGGIPPSRRLLTAGEVRATLRGSGFRDIQLALPEVSAEQRAGSVGLRRVAISAYATARRLPVLRGLLYLIGPLVSAVGRRGATPSL